MHSDQSRLSHETGASKTLPIVLRTAARGATFLFVLLRPRPVISLFVRSRKASATQGSSGVTRSRGKGHKIQVLLFSFNRDLSYVFYREFSIGFSLSLSLRFCYRRFQKTTGSRDRSNISPRLPPHRSSPFCERLYALCSCCRPYLKIETHFPVRDFHPTPTE